MLIQDKTFNIVDLIHFDVSLILRRFRAHLEPPPPGDTENQKYKRVKHYLISIDRELLNVTELTNYLETTAIANTARIDDIKAKALEIIRIQNEDFIQLEELAFSNHLNEKRSEPVDNLIAFECIAITGKEVYSVKSKRTYDIFDDLHPFKPWLTQELAQKCAAIINIITAFSNELNLNDVPHVHNVIDGGLNGQINKPTSIAFALKHIYLHKTGEGGGIHPNNANHWGETYGYSGTV